MGQAGCVQFKKHIQYHDAVVRQSQTNQNLVIFLNKTAENMLDRSALLCEATLKIEYLWSDRDYQ